MRIIFYDFLSKLQMYNDVAPDLVVVYVSLVYPRYTLSFIGHGLMPSEPEALRRNTELRDLEV